MRPLQGHETFARPWDLCKAVRPLQGHETFAKHRIPLQNTGYMDGRMDDDGDWRGSGGGDKGRLAAGSPHTAAWPQILVVAAVTVVAVALVVGDGGGGGGGCLPTQPYRPPPQPSMYTPRLHPTHPHNQHVRTQAPRSTLPPTTSMFTPPHPHTGHAPTSTARQLACSAPARISAALAVCSLTRTDSGIDVAGAALAASGTSSVGERLSVTTMGAPPVIRRVSRFRARRDE
eukprot:283387-Chlamydomonas_euryale.AAC.2